MSRWGAAVEGDSVLGTKGEEFLDFVDLLGLSVIWVGDTVRMLVAMRSPLLFYLYRPGSD